MHACWCTHTLSLSPPPQLPVKLTTTTTTTIIIINNVVDDLLLQRELNAWMKQCSQVLKPDFYKLYIIKPL
jgi:hypothetical protein